MIEYENLALLNKGFVASRRFQSTLTSGIYVKGAQVREFEESFSDLIGADYVVGVGNGYDALELSLRALELPSESTVLIHSNSYVATAMAVLNAGLKLEVFAPDASNYAVTSDMVLDNITPNVSAVIVTHMYGIPQEIEGLADRLRKKNVFLIEDCAQATTSYFQSGKHVGLEGVLGCFSFYPTKPLGALGDGGAVSTDDQNLSLKIRQLASYGELEKNKSHCVGRNSRLDEVQASFLLEKMKRLAEITSWKQELAHRYLANLPMSIMPFHLGVDLKKCSQHIFPVYVARDQRALITGALADSGIQTTIHYPIPLHRQDALSNKIRRCRVAELISSSQISLPIHANLTLTEIDRISEELLNVLSAGD